MTKIIYQDKVLFPEILWERPVHYYKAQGGKVLVLAGSRGAEGTAILTCEAVFRSGTGILVLGFPEKIKDFYKEVLPEAMTMALPSTYSGSLAKKAEEQILEEAKSCSAAIIGPSLSTNSETIHLIWQTIFELEIPMVLDSDGITAFVKGIEVMRAKESEEFLKDYLKKLKAPLVLTLTSGDAERIMAAAKLAKLPKENLKYINAHRKETAGTLASELGAFVVMKGKESVIASPKGDIIVSKVNYSADVEQVLSGIIGSFIAQNPDEIFEATATAVYLHDLAAKLVIKAKDGREPTASDIIKKLPEAIRIAENC